MRERIKKGRGRGERGCGQGKECDWVTEGMSYNPWTGRNRLLLPIPARKTEPGQFNTTIDLTPCFLYCTSLGSGPS